MKVRSYPKTKAIILKGKELEKLRRDVYNRDNQRCVVCGKWLPFNGSVFERAHLAHKIRRKKGGDTMENTQIKCYKDHILGEHGPKWSSSKMN